MTYKTTIFGVHSQGEEAVMARVKHHNSSRFNSQEHIRDYLKTDYADFLDRTGWSMSDRDIAAVMRREWLDKVSRCDSFRTLTELER